MPGLLPFTVDAVAVFNSSFQQVFIHARPARARVYERSALLDHPIENGQLITDYSIVLPIEIEWPIIVEAPFYRDTYQQIRNLYTSKELLTVQTNAANYPAMVIAEMPHEEKPEMFDGLPMIIKFRQIQQVPDPNTYVPLDPASVDTQPIGQLTGYDITGVRTQNGTATIPLGTETFSSVPPSDTLISGVQTPTGPQTIALQQNDDIPVTGVQTVTSVQSIGAGFAFGGGP